MGKRLKVCESLEEAQAVYDIGALIWHRWLDPVMLRPGNRDGIYHPEKWFAYYVEDDDDE